MGEAHQKLKPGFSQSSASGAHKRLQTQPASQGSRQRLHPEQQQQLPSTASSAGRFPLGEAGSLPKHAPGKEASYDTHFSHGIPLQPLTHCSSGLSPRLHWLREKKRKKMNFWPSKSQETYSCCKVQRYWVCFLDPFRSPSLHIWLSNLTGCALWAPGNKNKNTTTFYSFLCCGFPTLLPRCLLPPKSWSPFPWHKKLLRTSQAPSNRARAAQATHRPGEAEGDNDPVLFIIPVVL